MRLNHKASQTAKDKKKKKEDSVIQAIESATYDEIDALVSNEFNQKDILKALCRMVKGL